MGEFTGVFKEQEWEQSWSNMLTLWRGSFYHWQVTLSGNKARKWFGCVWTITKQMVFLFISEKPVWKYLCCLVFLAVIKSNVQISYHIKVLELSSVRLEEGITFNCYIFLHFCSFLSCFWEKRENSRDLTSKLLYCFPKPSPSSCFLTNNMCVRQGKFVLKIGSTWPCTSAQPCDGEARALLTSLTFSVEKNISGGESSVTHMRLL